MWLFHCVYHCLELGWNRLGFDVLKECFSPEHISLFARNCISTDICFICEVLCFKLNVVFDVISMIKQIRDIPLLDSEN